MVSICRICGRDDNRIQIRSGTGLCCNICEKIEKEDIDIDSALDYLWSINTNTALMNHEIIAGNKERTQNAAPQA